MRSRKAHTHTHTRARTQEQALSCTIGDSADQQDLTRPPTRVHSQYA